MLRIILYRDELIAPSGLEGSYARAGAISALDNAPEVSLHSTYIDHVRFIYLERMTYCSLQATMGDIGMLRIETLGK